MATVLILDKDGVERHRIKVTNAEGPWTDGFQPDDIMFCISETLEAEEI